MKKQYLAGGIVAAAFVFLFLFLIAYVVVDNFMDTGGSAPVKVKTNTIVKYICPSGNIVDDSSGCGSATTTVAASNGGETPVGCPPAVPCVCPGGKKPVTTLTTTIKMGLPCDVDSDCGQTRYGDVRCRSGSVYNIRIAPNCDDGHCKDLYTYEFKQDCSSGQTCINTRGCVKTVEAGN